MTTLTGIKNAQYLALFLGGKIAVRDGKNCYVYPHLFAIYSNGAVTVLDKDGNKKDFLWAECENPYVIMSEPDVKVEFK